MDELNWPAESAAFAVVLGVSVAVGVYYGCVRGKQNTIREYLLGGKHMAVFPITMSLIASHLSGITLLGVPTEVYYYGTQYLIIGVVNVVVVFAVLHIYLPVFYELQFTSVYEYLEQRFDSKVRALTSLLFALASILSIPIAVYIPALAYNQVTGINVHIITTIICVICIFYTTIGGLKAVVWADTIQIIFTTFSVVLVIVLGLRQVGGIDHMITTNQEGRRFEFFKMNPDPFLRNSFWTVSVGITLYWISDLGIHPGAIQRFVALPTYRKARNALVYYVIGIGIFQILSGLIGILIYTKYKDCDPRLADYIDSDKKLVPYYVMNVAGNIPGVTGLFVSGITSTALSTMSAQLNTVAGTIYEDFIVRLLGVRVSDLTASVIVKCTVAVTGVVCLVLVIAIEQLKGIIQMSYSLNGITAGGVLSVFTLGICFPWANSKGVMCGLLASLGVMTWIVTGAQLAIFDNELVFVEKNVSTAGCPANITLKNQTDFSGLYRMNEDVYAGPNVWKIYAISYMHYSTVGTLVGVAVGLVFSLIFSPDKRVDPKLLAPCIRKFVRPRPPVPKTNLNIIECEEHEL